MAIIPNTEQFIGFPVIVDTTERRSELVNAESQVYTMQDFIQTIGSVQGTQGPQGIPGVPGPQGIQGLQGAVGSVGANGAVGAQGIQGLSGPIGQVGIAGAQGVQGLQGFQGAAGPVGPSGLNWQGGWSPLGIYFLNDAVGYNGASWFCINNIGPVPTTPDIDPTNWALLASQGAVGPQGPQGTSGPQGLSGPIGQTGAQGAQGIQGLSGPAGASGSQGIQGLSGPIGQTGPQGLQGIQGVQGIQGASSSGFVSIGLSVLTPMPVATPTVADFITIPANTYNLGSQAVLDLVGQVSKQTANGTFKYEIYLTDVLQTVDTPMIFTPNPIKLVGAESFNSTQLTIKLERTLAVTGDDVYFMDSATTTLSNSDNALLSSQQLYNLTFDTMPTAASGYNLAPIDWTMDWYVVSVVEVNNTADKIQTRIISLK